MAIIYAGYRTGPADPALIKALAPPFRARGDPADKDKIAAALKAQQEAWLAAAATRPYTGVLDQLTVVDPNTGRAETWKSTGPESPESRFAGWIRREYPHAWVLPHGGAPKSSDVVLIGFGVRLLVDMLAAAWACVPPERAVSPGFWHENRHHKDLAEILKKGHDFSLPALVKLHGRGQRFDRLVEGWEPHHDSERDAQISEVVGRVLGFHE